MIASLAGELDPPARGGSAFGETAVCESLVEDPRATPEIESLLRGA
jgi:hypothetical protein